ncbi:MAG: hypothetical protein V7L11_03185 [Nostoc sp.]|uniref:type II toxin-antitoxin system HicB family antitoxin n=1 Tax=Nostoc sp. TaxID=1180 RepID=UPI002FF7A116
MNSLQDYTTLIRPDNNGTFVAYILAISGCHAWEQTPDGRANTIPMHFMKF